MTDRVRRRLLLAAGLSTLVPDARAAQEPPAPEPDAQETIALWPDIAPGAPARLPPERIVERSADPRQPDRAREHIAHPVLVVFRPQRPNGAAFVIAPGGGYQRVVIDKEGHELGRWLARRGVTAFVLFYRLPGDGWTAGPDVALADAQRAMRLVRHRATEFRIDPARVAALGFSAGGHVIASLATRATTATYLPVDVADGLDCRPCVAALVYPVVTMHPPFAHAGSRRELLGPVPEPAFEALHSPEQHVDEQTPPHFLLHAMDDPSVPVDNTLRLHDALRRRGVPVELHVLERGGHGFGLRAAPGTPAAQWPELLLAWVRLHDRLIA